MHCVPVEVVTVHALCNHASCTRRTGPLYMHCVPVELVTALTASLQGTCDQQTWEAAEGVVLSVSEEPGLTGLIEELLAEVQESELQTKVAALRLLNALCARSTAELAEHVPRLISFCTLLLNDQTPELCEAGWSALDAIVKVSKELE